MTDLITRLRVEQEEGYTICGEAADEIEHLAHDLQTERAAVVALRAELDALREDAARYRWLREQPIDGAPGMPVVAMPNGMRSGYYLNHETADYAIDAARKATP